MKFNKTKYMKAYNHFYAKALNLLRIKHPLEFKKILSNLIKGRKNGKYNY